MLTLYLYLEKKRYPSMVFFSLNIYPHEACDSRYSSGYYVIFTVDQQQTLDIHGDPATTCHRSSILQRAPPVTSSLLDPFNKIELL